MTVGSDTVGQRVGAANSGFYGVGLRPRTSYVATFFARATNYAGPLTVSLESNGGTVYGSRTTAAMTTAAPAHSAAIGALTLSNDARQVEQLAIARDASAWSAVRSLAAMAQTARVELGERFGEAA